MSEPTTLEAPKPEVKVIGTGKIGDEFSDKVMQLMEESKKVPDQAEAKPEVKKVDPPKEEAKKETEKPKTLLDGFDAVTKKPEPKTEAKEEPKGDVETNLANLRKLKEAAETERDQIKARLKEMETKPSVPADYEQLKADYELVTGELKKVKLEATPEFKRKYDQKLDKTTADIQKALGNTDINASEFLQLVKAPDSKERTQKIAELIEGLDKLSENKVSSAVSEFDRIRDERAAELVNPDEQLLKLTEAEKQQEAQLKEEQNNLIFAVIKETEADPSMSWLKENPELPEEWNKAIAQVKQTAVHLWQRPMPVKTQAQMALAASLSPLLFNLLEHSRKESHEQIAKLNEELAKYRKGTPSTNGGRSEKTTMTASESKDDAKNAFMNAFKKSQGTD